MNSTSFPTRELQATLIQFEADLRKLTASVQALTSQLSQATDIAEMASPLRIPEPLAGAGAARSATPDSSPACWRLREGGWTLVSPAGQRLALTTLERKFMLALFEAPNRSLARNELGALAPPRGEDGEKSTTSPRGVDVMVSRLRRKAQAIGMPLPLRSVRRWGYMFTEDVATE